MRRITLFRLDAIAFGYLTYFFTRKFSIISINRRRIILIAFPIFTQVISPLKINLILYMFMFTIAAILGLIKENYLKIPCYKKHQHF